MKLKYILIILLIILVSTSAMLICDRPSIHSASVEELTEINGIGNTLAIEVLSYLELNPEACIDDLEDVKYIGPITIKKIKKDWSD